MWRAVARARFAEDVRDEAATKAAYERHNAEVRASVAASQLVDWQPANGWGPICARLGMPVPDEAFPHTNTRAEMRALISEAGGTAPAP